MLQAQPLSFGVKAGVPFNDAVEGSFGLHSEERRYTIGPTVELRLPFSFAAEVSALYKRTGYSTTDSAFGVTTNTRVRANSWEFPILLKYYVPGSELPLKPFIEGGYVVRRLFGVDGVASSFGVDSIAGISVNNTLTLNNSFLTRDNPTSGVTAGGGLRISLGPLRLSPEVRYTRWIGRAFDEQGSRGFFVQSQQNQAEFLLGVSF
jgi:hypothetical protein